MLSEWRWYFLTANGSAAVIGCSFDGACQELVIGWLWMDFQWLESGLLWKCWTQKTFSTIRRKCNKKNYFKRINTQREIWGWTGLFVSPVISFFLQIFFFFFSFFFVSFPATTAASFVTLLSPFFLNPKALNPWLLYRFEEKPKIHG